MRKHNINKNKTLLALLITAGICGIRDVEAVESTKIPNNSVVDHMNGNNTNYRNIEINNVQESSFDKTKIIKNLVLKGNKKIKTDQILSLFKTKKNEEYSFDDIQSDVDLLKATYASMGMLDTEVSYEIKDIDNSRFVDIVFTIAETTKIRIGKINFSGNKVFRKSALYSAIFNKEKHFLTFGAATIYSKDFVDYDVNLIYEYYYNHGYLDVEIADVKTEFITKKGKKYANLTFCLNEGSQYRVADVNIESSIKRFDEEIFKRNLFIKTGIIFNNSLLKQQVRDFEKILKKKNFDLATVDVDYYKNTLDKRVNVVFSFVPGEKYYLRNIEIYGNRYTYVSYIRKELRISEGDSLTESEFNKLESRLNSTGLFSKIRIDKQQVEPNKYDIIINVEERPSGNLELGLAISTLDGLSFNTGLTQNNLLGRGYTFNISTDISKYTKNFGLGFGKPYLFNTNLFGGFSVFTEKNQNTKRTRNSTLGNGADIGYDDDNYGLKLYTIHYASDYFSEKLYYQYAYKKIYNVKDEYKDLMQIGKQNVSLIGLEFVFDTRDDNFYPTKGVLADLNVDWAGLGGNKDFIRSEIDLKYYYRLYKQFIFKAQTIGGVIRSLKNNSLYPDDGFYLGGDKLRGFSYGGIGPKAKKLGEDSVNNESISLGGTKYYVFNTELRFPLYDKRGLDLYGLLFFNAGNISGVEKNKNINRSRIVDSHKIRSAGGFGFVFKTPMGDISLEFSRPISKQRFDDTEKFRFNLGSSF